jgi:hypothetical protein
VGNASNKSTPSSTKGLTSVSTVLMSFEYTVSKQSRNALFQNFYFPDLIDDKLLMKIDSGTTVP